jgi:V/A-type H+/Na+-transporting ATPase subunit I
VIVNVEKYLFIGIKEDLDLFFQKAQQEGLIEFVPVSSKKAYSLPKSAQDLLTAIKILKKEEKKLEIPYGKEFELIDLVNRVIFLKNTLEKSHEEKRVLGQEIVKIGYFGEFSLKEIDEFERESQRCVQFFFRNQNKRADPLPSEGLIYIASDSHVDYYLGVHSEPKFFTNFVEIHFERSLSELERRLQLIEEELKDCHKELKELTGYIDFLTENFIKELNSHNLRFAKEEVEHYFEGELFSVEAWIPKMDLPKVLAMMSKLGVHMEKVAIDKQERVPTCMKNKGLRKIGEDLVKIYDIPSPMDKDPSGFVIAAFSIFFSMIVADAGYGFVYLLISLFAYFKFSKKSGALKRMIKLFIIISSSCILWGVVIGSYFGIEMNPQNPLQRVSLTRELVLKKAEYHMQQKDATYKDWVSKKPDIASINDPLEFVLSIKKVQGSSVSYEILEEFNNSILMEIAILVGVIHIMISLFRYMYRHLSSIGWICFIVGGYLFFPSVMNNATSIFNFLGLVPKKAGSEIGMQLVYIGIGVAWMFALFQHKKKGLEEPLKCIQIFADVLSYLRLYALSLAGIIMASTFNQMGRDVGHAFGYVFGFFIIVAGHMLNMTIGIMGGFIHGLRLNFLEWYHYSFDGGGKLFSPLKIIK